MGKSYAHFKPIAQDDKYGCWSASMAWWTKAVPTVDNYTDDEIKVEFGHLMGADGGLRFPEGFRQMLADPKWGLSVQETMYSYDAVNAIKTGLEKAPVMLGFWDFAVGGHHAVVVHDYHASMQKGNYLMMMDPNGGEHRRYNLLGGISRGHALIVGYKK
jgi:hypothetical protein